MSNKKYPNIINILGAVIVLLLAVTVILTGVLLVCISPSVPSGGDTTNDSDQVPSVPESSLPDGDTSGDNDISLGDTDASVPIDTPAADATVSDTTTKGEVTQPKPSKKLVALTYDDGPHAQYTPELLDVLKKYDVKATFFIIGQNTRTEAAKAALKRAASEGHEIANHSYTHPSVLKLSIDEVRAEFEKTNDAIYEICGIRPTLIRTPGGSYNKELLAGIDYPIIRWTVDTLDWKYNDPEQSLSYLKEQVYDGGIILMHDRKSNVAVTTELMINWLHENDYEIVTVSELMRQKGVELKKGYVYFSSSKIRN